MATSDRFTRPIYTPEQLEKFYDRIKLPKSIRSKIHSPDFTPDLDTLQTLQLYMVTSIPFESLSLHYNKDKKITISPDYLFKKIVDPNNGRGGYCMENNTLFGTVLRSMGYTAYPVGARVNSETNERNEPPVYFAWYVCRVLGLPFYPFRLPSAIEVLTRRRSHMVSIVLLNGIRYLVDVGFGASGPHHPLPLLASSSLYPMTNVGPSQIRLIHEPLPDLLDQTQKHWIVQHRYNEQARWITNYATPAIEFLPQDFGIMNLSTSSGPGLFTDNVICTVLIKDEQEEKLVGDLTLMNWDLKERRNGESNVLERFESEGRRVEGIRRWFGIVFGEEEKRAAEERWGGEGKARNRSESRA